MLPNVSEDSYKKETSEYHLTRPEGVSLPHRQWLTIEASLSGRSVTGSEHNQVIELAKIEAHPAVYYSSSLDGQFSGGYAPIYAYLDIGCYSWGARCFSMDETGSPQHNSLALSDHCRVIDNVHTSHRLLAILPDEV